MYNEINHKTSHPAIVAFRETLDGQLVVFTFCEKHPEGSDDWWRSGRCYPTYFMIMERRVYKFLYRKEMWSAADNIPLMTKNDIFTNFMVGRVE